MTNGRASVGNAAQLCSGPSAEGAVIADRQIACTMCGARHSEAAWGDLVLSQRIDAEEIGRLVRGWPEARWIEVRACHCGHLIAARRSAAASP